MTTRSLQASPGGDRNRSLERGVEVLRAFKPGTDLLGNGELAERTGLSRATVSRLCATLVACGFLERDRTVRAYRLAAPVLSLAHAMRSGSPLLAVAAPLMRAEAEKRRINVGLAVADRDEMVYL
jgi:DNA-binding IclR family transcriptional regulator